MRLAFFGTPTIAVPTLQALVGSRHDVVCVVTRPDRPAGRRRIATAPAVKAAAAEMGLAVLQPAKAGDCAPDLATRDLDVVVVVAYGGWLPPPILTVAPHGCVNVHPSLLPRWRGAAPIERAIMSGDTTTGVATMAIDEGLDTGPVFLEIEHGIRPDDTSASLAARLAVKGADLVLATLDGIGRGSLRPVAQPETGATYAEKLTPEGCRVDWSAPAAAVDSLIRAANPRPGAWTSAAGRRVKLWDSRLRAAASRAEPGAVVSWDPLLVAAGSDGSAVELVELQPDGGPRMSGEAYARGHRHGPGRFDR